MKKVLSYRSARKGVANLWFFNYNEYFLLVFCYIFLLRKAVHSLPLNSRAELAEVDIIAISAMNWYFAFIFKCNYTWCTRFWWTLLVAAMLKINIKIFPEVFKSRGKWRKNHSTCMRFSVHYTKKVLQCIDDIFCYVEEISFSKR